MTLRRTEDYTELYAEPGAHSIIDVIDPDTQLTAINGETHEQIRARYPAAERITWAAWSAARAAEQDTPIRWTITTRETYHEMLEVLPPALWISGAFLVGEPMDHHAGNGQPRFSAYWAKGGAYFVASRPITCSELRAELAR